MSPATVLRLCQSFRAISEFPAKSQEPKIRSGAAETDRQKALRYFGVSLFMVHVHK